MKRIRFLFALISLVGGCGLAQKEIPDSEDADVYIPIDHDYNEVSEWSLTWESIFEMESDNYYVYFYSMSCNHCTEVKNYMIEKCLERGDIYFVKGTRKDQLTKDQNKLIGAEKPEDFYILGYPSLALIHNKKCTKNVAGISQIKQELN